ncbi:MAG: thioesterase family protein [Gemmatimonadaceae bacterium]
MSKQPFIVHEHVRWADVDPARIIRYDAYTRFFELGESELFRSLGIPYTMIFTRFEISLPRRAMHMEFVSPPLLDERLEVATYISNVGTTSMTLNFDIYGEGGVMRMFGHLIVVCASIASHNMTKRPWPTELLRMIDPYRMSVEEGRQGRVSLST